MTRVHTHNKDGKDSRQESGNGNDRPTAHLQSRANAKYAKHADHLFGYLRASIFRRLQADLGLLLAALGAQQRHAPAGFSFLPPRPRLS